MKLNTHALFKALSCFLLMLFACSYHTISAVYQELSFDNLFPATLYKNALDESMALYSDLQALREENSENRNDHCLCVDATVGRCVRLIGSLDLLSAHQQTTQAHLQEDGAYLLMVLEQVSRIYQSVVPANLYPSIINLFNDALTKVSRAFLL